MDWHQGISRTSYFHKELPNQGGPASAEIQCVATYGMAFSVVAPLSRFIWPSRYQFFDAQFNSFQESL